MLVIFIFILYLYSLDALNVWGDHRNNVHVTSGNSLLKIDKSSKMLTTVAGAYHVGFSGDNGPGTSAKLNLPEGFWINPNDDWYLADSGNKRVRRISSSGIITTVAGSSGTSQSQSAAATSIAFIDPSSVFGDSMGTVYTTERGRHVVYKLIDGMIRPVVGNFIEGATSGTTAAGIAATSASLRHPTGVWVDGTSGWMFIADTGNNKLRVMDLKTGVMNSGGIEVDGIVGIFGEYSLKLKRTVLYLTSSTNNAVYIFDIMSTGVWLTLAGGGGVGNGGNGVSSIGATLNNPSGIWKEPLASVNDEQIAYLYIADADNGVVRKLTWDLKIFDYYGGHAQIHTQQPVSAPSVVPSFRPTDSSVKQSADKSVPDSSSSVGLIVVITVCILLLLGGVVLCVLGYLYDWSPRQCLDRMRPQQQPANEFEFVTYKALPSGDGTHPI